MNQSKEVLLSLYRTMLRIRQCEESLVPAIVDGRIRCPVHLYSGQEAVAAGVCAALSQSDYVFGTHRSHGHYLAKGGDMRELVAEIFCRETGCSRGRGGSMHIAASEVGMLGAAPIVAGTISLALGAALAGTIRGDGRVAVAFFGDGAAGEGVLYESLNFAALRSLPVVFVCENNLYSTHLPIRECRANERLCEMIAPLGLKGASIDGNDVLAVYEAAQQAVSDGRSGQGPWFLECRTYRYRGHVGPDDNVQGARTDIRPSVEVAEWRRKDPIVRLQETLSERFGVEVRHLDTIRAEVDAEVAAAVAFAEDSPFPASTEEMRYVFTA